MDISDYSGLIAVVIISLVVFIAGVVAGAGGERTYLRALYTGLAGVAAVSILTFIASILVATSDDEAALSSTEEIANAALNAGLVLFVGGLGIGGGYGLSWLQRSRQISGAKIAVIITAVLVSPLIISGFFLGCAYLFSDVGLDPPPTATPAR